MSDGDEKKRVVAAEEEDGLPPVDGLVAWLNVAGSFINHAIAFGHTYSFSLFVKPYEEQFPELGRESISLIFQLQLGALFLMGLFAGKAADNYGPRPVMFVGIALYAAGHVLASFAQEFWQVALTQGLIVGVANACLYWPSVTNLPMWFEKRRALALGLAVLGAGIGNFALSLVLEALLKEGTAYTLRIMAVYSSALLIVAAFLQRRRLALSANKGFCSNREIFKDRNFIVLAIGALTFNFGYTMPFAHLAPYAEGLGFDTDFAALSVACLGIGSAVGRVALGFVADAFGRVRTFQFCLLSTAFILLAWYWCTTEPSIIAFALLFSFSSGGFIALVPVVAAAYFGPANLGSIMGLVSVCLVPGAFLGAYIGATVFDSTGSYDNAILITAGLTFLPAFAVFFLEKEPTEPKVSGAVADASKMEGDSLSFRRESV